MSKLLFFQHSHDFHLCTTVFQRLQDTTAQIRVRGAFMLLVAFVALTGALGLETILGAFISGFHPRTR